MINVKLLSKDWATAKCDKQTTDRKEKIILYQMVIRDGNYRIRTYVDWTKLGDLYVVAVKKYLFGLSWILCPLWYFLLKYNKSVQVRPGIIIHGFIPPSSPFLVLLDLIDGIIDIAEMIMLLTFLYWCR